jgi:periplasmic divalent cation tolerance protein
MTGVFVVLVTVPTREVGDALAEALVGETLAACVNLVGPIRSIYRWQGEVCRDDEYLLLIKTTADRYDALETRVRALHPYDNPEVVALPLARGADAYVEWVRRVTGAA